MSLPWQRAIVVGASSGIGAEIARQLGAAGCEVALVARREPALRAVAAGHAGARCYPHDVTAYGEVPGLFARICQDLGGLDLIVYASGVMPRIAADEYDFARDQPIIAVNVLGAIAWLNEAARRFAEARSGTIVGISSVAGDRGRRGNPVYCASKAALDTYLEALRNRVGARGVAVVTVKPGPVDTPMTQGLAKLPLLVAVDAAVTQILADAARRRRVSYVPRTWRPIMAVLRNIPSRIFQHLDI